MNKSYEIAVKICAFVREAHSDVYQKTDFSMDQEGFLAQLAEAVDSELKYQTALRVKNPVSRIPAPARSKSPQIEMVMEIYRGILEAQTEA